MTPAGTSVASARKVPKKRAVTSWSATPRPVWLDAMGETVGRPPVATTLLNGRHQLEPRDVAAWARGLAAAMAAVHRAPIAHAELDFLVDQATDRDRRLTWEPSTADLA